jgi:hypothetical protein
MAFIFNITGLSLKNKNKFKSSFLNAFVKKGDSFGDWYTSKFQMFKNGSYWQPPKVNRFTKFGRNEAYERAKSELMDRKGQLSDELVMINSSLT